MKKLFNTSSFIAIDDFSSVRITGPYELLKLGPDYATIKCGGYKIEASGADLLVDVLSEEVAIFAFTAITNLIITMNEHEEETYGS